MSTNSAGVDSCTPARAGPDVPQLLMDVHQHEVDPVASVLAAFASRRKQSEAFIARAAGGLFDCLDLDLDLDLDRDEVLEVADLESHASADFRPIVGIRAKPAHMPRLLRLSVTLLGRSNLCWRPCWRRCSG